uniref:EF-hand domain-containing protein n=4 Tax=Aegilops tauschii subsp. strangulata TaxID=200361 RepID=A0A453PIB4_AEGTS
IPIVQGLRSYKHDTYQGADAGEKKSIDQEPGSIEEESPETMGAGQRMASPPAAVAVPLLLLFVVPFWSHVASADGGAPAWTTALQKHVAFFDADSDGIVSFSETERGLRAIGLGAAEATVKATLINGVIGPKTRPENATTSKFSIYIENIHQGIHGSDSGSYDAQGRFVPAKFNEIFTKHAKVEPNAVNESELEAMRIANREDGDDIGRAASKAEWDLLHSLAKDKDGFLQKDNARTVFDDSLFVQLAKKGE